MKTNSTKNKDGGRGKEKIKNPDNLVILRERLRKKTEDYSCLELEDMTDVPDSSIKSITNGDRTNIKIDNLISIAKGLGTSIDYLVGLSDYDSVDVSLKDISKKTHLSKESIDTLMHDLHLLAYIDSFNELLSSCFFPEFIEAFHDYLHFCPYLEKDIEGNKYHLNTEGIESGLLYQCVERLQKLRKYSITQAKLNAQALKSINEEVKKTGDSDSSPKTVQLRIKRIELEEKIRGAKQFIEYTKERRDRYGKK